IEGLARCKELERVREIRCEGDPTPIVSSPHVTSLRVAWLEGKGVCGALEKMANDGSVRSLEDLSLWYLDDPGRAIEAVARATTLPQLERFMVVGSNPSMSERPLRMLVESPLAPCLRRLELEALTAEMARGLSRGRFDTLEDLSLRVRESERFSV